MPLNGPSILLVAEAKPWGTLCSSPLRAHIQYTTEAYRLYFQIHTESDYFSLLLLCHAAEAASSLDCRRAPKPAPCVLLAPLWPILNTAAPGSLLKSVSDHVTLVLQSLPCTTFQQERAVGHRTLCNLVPMRSLPTASWFTPLQPHRAPCQVLNTLDLGLQHWLSLRSLCLVFYPIFTLLMFLFFGELCSHFLFSMLPILQSIPFFAPMCPKVLFCCIYFCLIS